MVASRVGEAKVAALVVAMVEGAKAAALVVAMVEVVLAVWMVVDTEHRRKSIRWKCG